jgi:hypothetical protein
LVSSVIGLIFGIIIVLVGFRLLFRLLGANPENGLVSWVYSASEPLVQPFFGMFNGTIDVTTGRFELESLIALIVYAIIAAVLTGITSRGGHPAY